MVNCTNFEMTPSEVAREAGATAEIVRLYADMGLIESRRLSNGTRLLKRSAAAEVREIRLQRLANRGRKLAYGAPTAK